MKPLIAAMEQVDRAALGFTPITDDAKISLEGKRRDYDAMLHVYGKTSRTIAFRKTPSGYRWISEQETHLGPKWAVSVDGPFREGVTIEYQTEKVNGIPTNQLHISYSGLKGPGELALAEKLTLAEVQPMLEAWKTAPIEPQPPDLPSAEFPDIVPSMFLFGMFIIVLIICFFGLLLGIFAALVLAGFITAGIISASVMTAVLKRSVSSGFRALFLQIGGVLGLATGAVGAMLFIWLAKIPSDSPQPWIIGLIAGLLWGVLSACLFNFAWHRIVEWIAAKLPRRKTELPETTEEANADEGNPKVRP